MIANKLVVRVSYPETARSLISDQKRERSHSLDSQVVEKVVLSLNGIFNEKGVTHSGIGNVVHNSQVVHSMNSAGTIVSIVD